MTLIKVVCLLTCASCFVLPLAAQYTTASLGGSVADESGALVPDAKLTVRNADTGFSETTSSDAAGAFLFARLPIGRYTLQVEKQGFPTYEQAGITLAVNQEASLRVLLKLGQLTERVTVEANADLVVTRSATSNQLIDRQRVAELPLNGRLAQSLLNVAVGTVDLGRNGCVICGQGGVYPGEATASVNGAQRDQVNYQLDAVSHNDTYLNASLPFPNPDALQEFSLQSGNFSAEYGNAGGGVVNVVTKSGTNELHGSAFDFLRNGALNARNFFAPKQDTLKRNQFGGAVGGPIKKDKLFFFGTYQGTRTRIAPAGNVTFVPTPAERTGDFSSLLPKQLIDPLTNLPVPNNQIPADRISPVSQYFLKWIPLPNGVGRQVTFPGTTVAQTENQFMTKVDYNLRRQQISGRYFLTDFKQPAVIPKDNVLAAASSGNAVRLQNVSVIHNFTVSPTLLLNTTFGLNRQRGGSLSSAPFSFADAGVKIANSGQSELKAPPELSLSVTGGFGIGTNHLGAFDRGDYTVREVATKIIGGHELRFGGEALRVLNHITNTFQMDGSFSFSGELSGDGLADFMFGRSSTFSQGGGEFKDLKGTKWTMFLQDNWRVTGNLTLNIGLRWDPYLAPYDRQGRVICFQPGAKSARYPKAPAGLIYGGDAGCPTSGMNNSWGNFAPRLGFAYRLTQDGKTSIRGGIGNYYTPIETTDFNAFADIAPFAPTFRYNAVSFQDPFGSVGITNPFPAQYGPTVRGPDVDFTLPAAVRWTFAKDFRIPLITSWNLILERQVGKDLVLKAAYQATKGTYLSQAIVREVNPAIYIPGQSMVANTQARRPYQDFVNVGRLESGNNSNYNALQLTAEKRFGHGLSVLANYTWSKAIDDLGWSDPFDRSFDRAVAGTNIPHNFKFSNVWEAPNPHVRGPAGKLFAGWMLNSMVVWQSGFPMTISSGRDNSFSGVGRDRADFLGGSADLGSGRSHGDMVAKFFDTSKFVANAVGTFGNSGRDNLRGPKFFNADLGAIKNTKIRERVSLQFRAEFFNVFNNVNFRPPTTNAASAQFGRITAAADPRILQFALKVVF
jgi:hypothetical protein